MLLIPVHKRQRHAEFSSSPVYSEFQVTGQSRAYIVISCIKNNKQSLSPITTAGMCLDVEIFTVASTDILGSQH